MVDEPAPPPLVLAVRMSADEYRQLDAGGNYRSSDAQRSVVSRFLRDHGLPDPDPFTSLAVFRGEIPRGSAFNAYGTVTGYLDLVRILPRVVLVAADDVQDASVNRHAGRLRAVEGDEATRRVTLTWAAGRPFGRHYAEARVEGTLIRADFASFDVSGDFGLSLEQLAK